MPYDPISGQGTRIYCKDVFIILALKTLKDVHVGLSVETCFVITFHLLNVTIVAYVLPLLVKVAITYDKCATVHKCTEEGAALNRVNRACQLYYPHRIVLRTQGRKFQAVFAKTNWGLSTYIWFLHVYKTCIGKRAHF